MKRKQRSPLSFNSEGYVLIPLDVGLFAIADQEDAEYLQQFNWLQNSNGEAYRCLVDRRTISMHRDLLGSPTLEIDHKNGNRLDNRRSNLRLATHSQNLANSRIRPNNKSGFKGVNKGTGNARWAARITVNYKLIQLGLFNSPENAALAYDEAARHYFGEFACLNFPRKGERGAR